MKEIAFRNSNLHFHKISQHKFFKSPKLSHGTQTHILRISNNKVADLVYFNLSNELKSINEVVVFLMWIHIHHHYVLFFGFFMYSTSFLNKNQYIAPSFLHPFCISQLIHF